MLMADVTRDGAKLSRGVRGPLSRDVTLPYLAEAAASVRHRLPRLPSKKATSASQTQHEQRIIGLGDVAGLSQIRE